MSIKHVAGPLVGALQRCSRCDDVILDNAHADTVDGKLSHWPEGETITVRSSYATTADIGGEWCVSKHPVSEAA